MWTAEAAIPVQNHTLAHGLALSLNCRKAYKKHSPVTLPSLPSSIRCLTELELSCWHEIHPPTPPRSQPQLTDIRSFCPLPPCRHAKAWSGAAKPWTAGCGTRGDQVPAHCLMHASSKHFSRSISSSHETARHFPWFFFLKLGVSSWHS